MPYDMLNIFLRELKFLIWVVLPSSQNVCLYIRMFNKFSQILTMYVPFQKKFLNDLN